MLHPLAAALALLAAAPVAAQQVDEQLWLQANAGTQIDSQTSLTLESIGRFSDRADGFAHSEFGGIVTRKLNDTIEIGFGYRHIQDYDHGLAVPNLERLRQTITFALGSGFTTRTRLEQTFSSAGPGIGLRWRQQLRYARPIGGGVEAFATHESFVLVNDTRWGQRRGYDRMRHTIGLQVPLSEKLRGEAGYLNQYGFGRGGDRDEMDHIATFALTLAL